MINDELNLRYISINLYDEKGLRSLSDISNEIEKNINELENQCSFEYQLSRYLEPPTIEPKSYATVVLRGIRRGK